MNLEDSSLEDTKHMALDNKINHINHKYTIELLQLREIVIIVKSAIPT